MKLLKKNVAIKREFFYDVSLPRAYDGVVINLVCLMNNAPYENYISEFIPLATAVSESEETVVIDDLGDLGFYE